MALSTYAQHATMPPPFALLYVGPTSLPRPASLPGWSLAHESRCTANEATACLHVRTAYERALGTARNPAKAFETYTRGCKLGLEVSCTKAYQMVTGECGLAADFQAYSRYISRSCQLNQVASCIMLGDIKAASSHWRMNF